MSTMSQTHPTPARKPNGALRLGLLLVLLAVIAAGVIGFHLFKAHILKGVVAGVAAQRPTVSTTIASNQPWTSGLNGNGSLRASKGANLSAEVGGIVGELHVESGAQVRAGALLMRLRPDDDDAKLAELQATAGLDAITYQRDLKQLQSQAVAQSTVDTDAGNLKTAQAQVAAQKALIAEKFVRAPFAGKLGLRQVDLGQYLSPGTEVVTLQALDPMFLDFYLPQQSIGQVRAGQDVTVHVDAYPGRGFPGRVAAITPQADSSSRMIQVRATMANPGQVLLPGMFATVTITTRQAQPYVTVPLTAISANPYGSLVYVVGRQGQDSRGKPNLIARQVFVTTGDTRGDQVQVLKGVQAGDEVVTSGQLKLHNAAPVLVDNTVKPTANPNPTPADE